MGRGHGGSRGGGGASGFQGDATMRGMSAGLAKALTEREKLIRQNDDYEMGTVYDEHGNVVFNNDHGNTGSVYLGADYKDRIVTHSHPMHGVPNPFGQSLSGGKNSDIDIAMRYDAKEFRAVTRNYTYTIKRPAQGWGNPDRMVKEWKKVSLAVNRRDNKFLESYKGDKAAENRRLGYTRAHRINKEFARKFGIEYIKLRVN